MIDFSPPILKISELPVPITAVHESYCSSCPSKWHKPDPESEEIAGYPDGVRQQYVFPCAWRPNKLCKGVCEELGYDENSHKNLLINRAEI